MVAAGKSEIAVLVAGAGPVGLTMGCELLRHGVTCRVIDRNSGPTPLNESRALGIQARTMEVFREVGVVEGVLARARPFHGASAFSAGERVAHLTFDFDDLDTRYPHVYALSQAVTERLLIERFEALGGKVERETDLAGFRQDATGVVATLGAPSGAAEEARFDWLVGCDGSRSVVRKTLALAFEGGEYEERFLLADLDIDWGIPVPTDEVCLFLTPEGPLLGFPFSADGRWRLVDTTGAVDATDPGAIVARFRELVTRHVSANATLSDPSWTSSFHIHRRVVSSFRSGRVFVAGDAAHLHSPAGGQGMNTGVQDAFNLAWKLALVSQGRAPDALLDSYTLERKPAVAAVLTGSDLLTRVVTLRNPVAKGVRDTLMKSLGEFDFVRKKAARAISELTVSYRESPAVAEDHAVLARALAHPTGVPGPRDAVDFLRGPHAGDRAPDVDLGTDGSPLWLSDFKHPNRHTLWVFDGEHHAGPEFEAAVQATLTPRFDEVVEIRRVAREATDGTIPDLAGIAHRRYGARGPCLYLVRPDGYVGYRGLGTDASGLVAYLSKLFRVATTG